MSAALPPKSSNFRGVTLFKPSGKWRAQVGTGRAGVRRARGGAPGGAGDHDAARPGRRAGFAGCGCRGQPQCCHGIESGQLAGTPGGGGERGDAARRALRPTTPGRLFLASADLGARAAAAPLPAPTWPAQRASRCVRGLWAGRVLQLGPSPTPIGGTNGVGEAPPPTSACVPLGPFVAPCRQSGRRWHSLSSRLHTHTHLPPSFPLLFTTIRSRPAAKRRPSETTRPRSRPRARLTARRSTRPATTRAPTSRCRRMRTKWRI